jgi:hypothetical protein
MTHRSASTYYVLRPAEMARSPDSPHAGGCPVSQSPEPVCPQCVISAAALTASCVFSFSVFSVVRNRLLNGLSLLPLVDALPLYDLSGAA